MYLFILESIGTSELLLIGLVALIVFGPRKLPEMMKMFGKAMAEFRKSTNEFKESWEREVSIENLNSEPSQKTNLLEDQNENSIGRNSYPLENEIVIPEVKEISQHEFDQFLSTEKNKEIENSETENTVKISTSKSKINDKHDWL
jgi:Tat protein translocase TatB subunit